MSKQRNLRKSRLSFADEEEDDEGEQGSVALPPAAVKAAQQQKLKEKRAEKKVSLLSFDEDGDGDDGEGAVKRPGSKGRSRGLRIPAAAGIPPSRAATYTQVAAAGEYTAEKLKDLQRATQRAPRTGGGGGAGPSSAPAMPLPPPPLPTAADDYAMLDDEEDVGAAAIPDPAAIQAAKAQRERLRSVHAAPDYIALGGGGAGGGDDAYGVAARIRDVRERQQRREAEAGSAAPARGSDEEEEPEEVVRVQFGAGGAGRGGRPAVALAAGGGDEEDEEEAAWAEEQIRKGVRSGGVKASAQGTPKAAAPRPPSGVGFLPPSQAAAVAAAADEAVEALRAAVQRAQLSQKQAEKNLGRTERSLEGCLAGIARAEGELTAAGDKYVYVQQLRAYVADLCAMLAEKSPLVEELQEELQRAREERTAAHFRRCADAERAARAPAEAAVAAALGALTAGQGEPAARAAAAAAAEAADAEVASGAHLPVQLDEFGRDANVHRRIKLADRVSRRAAAEAAMDAAAAAADAEGGATTSESEDEVEGYRRRRGDVLEAAGVAFRDAADDFGSLAAVKARLEGWKAAYPGQYADSYMADSVPALFAPFVRAQLLSWGPLDAASEAPHAQANGGAAAAAGPPTYLGFDAQEWHRLLFDYGMPRDGGAPDPSDADADLIPRLVKALVVPAVRAALERAWNPFSARQSAAVAAMLGEASVYFDPGSEVTAGLAGAALRRLEQAAAAVNVPSWPPAALNAAPWGARYQERAFRRGLRVLRSAAAFREALPPAPLQALVVRGLAAGKLLPHVRAAAADPTELARRAGLLLDAVPAEWMAAGPPRGLEALGDVVAAAVRALEPAAGTEERREAAAPAAAALAGVVQRLGDAEGARRLRLMFGVA